MKKSLGGGGSHNLPGLLGPSLGGHRFCPVLCIPKTSSDFNRASSPAWSLAGLGWTGLGRGRGWRGP